MKPPFTYDYLNSVDSQIPNSFLHIHNTGVSRFFKRLLMLDTLSVFEWKLPESWDSDYFRFVLMGFGWICIFKTDQFGIIPQWATLSGLNVFYRPTRAIVTNPLINSRELDINRNCVILKLSPDYKGLADVVDYYGDLLALCYESLSINILNSRLSYVIGVNSKAEADTFKVLYDEIASGKPAVVRRENKINQNLGKSFNDQWQTLLQNIGQNFIAPEMLDSLNQIRDEFLTVIGIPNLSERKKERVNTIDSERNSFETKTKIDLWLEELQDGIDKAVKMFPELSGNLSVKKRFEERRINNYAGENVSSGTLQLR